MFIKKIYRAECTIKNNLSLFEQGSHEWLLEKSKMQVLGRIIHYIRTEGVKRGTAKAKLDALMQTHFDYERVGAMFNTSANSIQASMSYLSKNLENKVGKDTIDLLLSGKVEESISNFETCSNTYLLEELILMEFSERIPITLPRQVSIADCGRELEFLRSINIASLRQQFASLELEKFILIRYILESRDGRYKSERQAIHQYLIGNNSILE